MTTTTKKYYFVDSLGKKIYIKLLCYQFNESFVYAEDYFYPEKKYHVSRGRVLADAGPEEESLIKLEV